MRPGLEGATLPTDRRYTGQRFEADLGLYDYQARYYDPVLGRFISADSIVPGAASGAGGGAVTLGYDPKTRLTSLTVNLGEFAQQINAENREILQFGWFFQWDARTRREHNVPSGPLNPQALNRYAYVLNNPLRYVDPTGHWNFELQLTKEECEQLIGILDKAGDVDFILGLLGTSGSLGSGIAGLFYQMQGGFPGIITPESIILLEAAFPLAALCASPPGIAVALAVGAIIGIDSTATYRDFDEFHDALLEAHADSLGATISMKGMGVYRFSVISSYKQVSFTTASFGLLGSALPSLFGSYALFRIR